MSQMSPTKKTKTLIILAAIEILKSEGTEGLTMRKVANAAGISLGNLQYHYKDRAALMGGIAGYYFDACGAMFEQYEYFPPNGTAQEQLRGFLRGFLSHFDQISDMCRMFREIWSLSTRNNDIHEQMVAYYKATLQKLTGLLLPLCKTEDGAVAMASFLMPYFEGYSITAKAMPQSTEQTVEMLLKLCEALGEVRQANESNH